MDNQQQDAQRRALSAHSNEPASTDSAQSVTSGDKPNLTSAPDTLVNDTSEAANLITANDGKPEVIAPSADSTPSEESPIKATSTNVASTNVASTEATTTKATSANTTNTKADPDPISTAKPRQSPKDNGAISRKSSWSMRLAVLLSLSMGAAALAGGYYLYQQLLVQFHHSKTAEENAANALKEPVSRIGSLEQHQQQMVQLERQLEARLGKLSSEQNALERGLANLAQKTPDDWIIAEADYLVRMAGRKLWLEQDPTTALSLLKAADERIAAMQNTALLPLRKALAADIVQVSSVRSIDIARNVYALDEIIKQLDALQLGRSQHSYRPAQDDNLSNSIDDWQTNLAKSWKALVNDFITVRHRASDITPLLSPEQEWYLKENIRAKLLQAQLALYRHDETSFKNAITLANGWVTQYFSLNEGSGASIKANLDQLATLQIDPLTHSQFQASELLRTLVQTGGITSSPSSVITSSVAPEPATALTSAEAATSSASSSMPAASGEPAVPSEPAIQEPSTEVPATETSTEPAAETATEKQEHAV